MSGVFTMIMKQQLLADFGVELNLGDDEGCGTKGAPFSVLDTAMNDGLITAVTCLQMISKNLERTWQLNAISTVDDIEPALIKISLNVVLLTVDQYITETVSYYFHFENIKDVMPTNLTSPVLGLDSATELIIPLSLGWVQFETHRFNEPKEMGVTYEFGSRFLNAGIFIYNNGYDDIGHGLSMRLPAEFKAAIGQVQEAYPDFELCGSVENHGTVWSQRFSSDAKTSILAMAAINGNFVKLRLTSPHYQELEEAIQRTFGEFRHLTRLAISNQ